MIILFGGKILQNFSKLGQKISKMSFMKLFSFILLPNMNANSSISWFPQASTWEVLI